jgi:hypothetical protein
MANVRTVLNLSQEAVDIIDQYAPSMNKKGAWASYAIVEYARIMAGIGDLNGDDTTGILERIDSRLARMEKQLAVMSVERAG